jgi:hypothetical protein
MADDPKPEAPEADEEFERVLRNLVNTPHKPHNDKRGSGEPSPRPASDQEKHDRD